MAFVDCKVLHYHPQKIVHLNNLKKNNLKKVVKKLPANKYNIFEAWLWI